MEYETQILTEGDAARPPNIADQCVGVAAAMLFFKQNAHSPRGVAALEGLIRSCAGLTGLILDAENGEMLGKMHSAYHIFEGYVERNYEDLGAGLNTRLHGDQEEVTCPFVVGGLTL